MIHLKPGEPIKRVDLHEQYGGRRQGGISPSREDAERLPDHRPDGRRYGYIYDGWSEDGFFHYTGEGQEGDQAMAQGNRAIRDHVEEGRELHLFEAHGTELEYIGEFRYHDDYQADAPSAMPARRRRTRNALRKVIVFRLEEMEGARSGPLRTRLDRLGTERIKEVPVEQALTESMVVRGPARAVRGRAPRARLVRSLAEQLESAGHDVCRLQFRPDGEPAPLFCDLFDKTTNTLYESKSTVTRPATRMGIGQLADYARLIDPAPKRVLLCRTPAS